jgi:outer membrane protein
MNSFIKYLINTHNNFHILQVRFLSHILIYVFFFSFLFAPNVQSQNWTLIQCIDTALKNNLTIQQFKDAAAICEVDLNQSKSNMLPSLSGGIGQSYDLKNSSNSNISLNGSVTLFNGFQNRNTIKQSQLDFQASKYDVETQKNNIVLNVIDAYLKILYAEELVKNAKAQVDAIQLQLDDIQQFVSVGKKSESDLFQVKSELSSEKLTFINAEGQTKSAKLNLQQILNIHISKTFDIEYPLTIEPKTEGLSVADDIYKLALTQQPIIKSYELKTQSSLYSLKIAKGAVYPRLSLSGNFGTNYSDQMKNTETTYLNTIQNIGYLQSSPSEIVVGNISTPIYTYTNYSFGDQFKDNFSKSLSLSLSIPIYSNNQVKNNIKKKEIMLKNTLLEEQGAKNDLRKVIEQKSIEVENAIAKYIATKEKANASQTSYENAKTKYENGMMSMTDLLIELNTYTKAQSENIQARYELIYNLKILDYYKGVPLTF